MLALSSAQLSAGASLLAAFLVVVASNKQWWTISFNGVMITRCWARGMLFAAAGWIATAFVLLVTPSNWTPWVVGLGLGGTTLIAPPLARFIHRRAVAKFRRDNPGLAGMPLAGTFDCGPLLRRRRR